MSKWDYEQFLEVFAQSDGWRYETLRITKHKPISPLSR